MCSAPVFYVKKVVSSKNLLPFLLLYNYTIIRNLLMYNDSLEHVYTFISELHW